MDAKLVAITQRLSSEYENERANAASILERMSGEPLAAIIQQAAVRTFKGEQQHSVLGHVHCLEGDEMIVAVGHEIAARGVSWGEMVQAGLRDQMAKAAATDAKALWDEAMASMFEFSAFARRGPNQDDSSRKAREGASAKRVGRDDLPVNAWGVPRVERTGRAKNGNVYAVVSFREIEAHGQILRPMCEFIAFGTGWVNEIESAEDSNIPVFVRFHDDGNRGKLVQIKEAR